MANVYNIYLRLQQQCRFYCFTRAFDVLRNTLVKPEVEISTHFVPNGNILKCNRCFATLKNKLNYSARYISDIVTYIRISVSILFLYRTFINMTQLFGVYEFRSFLEYN